jgi:hypothetical protein
MATPGYSGCSRVGGVDRIGLTKLVSPSGLCFDLNIWLTAHDADPALTLPKDWTYMSASARPCTGSGPSTTPTTVTGSVDWPPQIGFTLPPAVNLDITFTFAANTSGVPATEALKAQNVDIRAACQQ